MALPKNHENYSFYRVWVAMRHRCDKPYGKNSCYAGIKYDEKWSDFDNFFDDMYSGYEHGLTLDRIDGKKGYNKENCRWVTMSVQANNKSNNRKLTMGDVTKNLAEWAKELGLNRTAITQRIDSYGWSVEKALMTPVRKRG